jgi:hypothetical protein
LKLNHAIATPVRRRSVTPQDAAASTNAKAVLKDLFELLEEYGPIWYTEELHIRVRMALSDIS